MARQPKQDQTQATVAVDPNPTADKESRDFENDDDRRRREHELALLGMRQGLIGKITGSSNESLNNGALVLLILAILLCIAEWVQYSGVKLDNVTDGIIKIMLTVVGFIFGAGSASRNR